MASNLKVVANDREFQSELNSAGNKLVVVDFFATWCQPCVRIAPVFAEYAARYPSARFLKVDVDQCQETAVSQGVSAMPTFIFYKSKAKLDQLKGADPQALEEKIKAHYVVVEDEGEAPLVKGHGDLNSFIQESGSECLNEADDHPFSHCLTKKGGFLESDCDEQLILHLAFNQQVKIHSLQIQAPVGDKLDQCPKTVKVFINLPHTLDFDKAEGMDPTQTLELTAEDMEEGAVIPLFFVKFQNVGNITLFFEDNQGGAETTQIDYIGLLGSPLIGGTTNMADFKRVTGKKGESH